MTRSAPHCRPFCPFLAFFTLGKLARKRSSGPSTHLYQMFVPKCRIFSLKSAFLEKAVCFWGPPERWRGHYFKSLHAKCPGWLFFPSLILFNSFRHLPKDGKGPFSRSRERMARKSRLCDEIVQFQFRLWWWTSSKPDSTCRALQVCEKVFQSRSTLAVGTPFVPKTDCWVLNI